MKFLAFFYNKKLNRNMTTNTTFHVRETWMQIRTCVL